MPNAGGGFGVGGAAKPLVIDEATHTLTGGSPTEVVTLGITISDINKVVCVLRSCGATKVGGAFGVAYQLTSSTEITLYNARPTANLVSGNKFHYQIIQTPTGHVERGSDTIAITTSWAEYDIDLVSAVDLVNCQPKLNHAGSYLWLNAAGTAGAVGGYIKPHASNNLKLSAGLIANGAGLSPVIYWEVLSP